MAGSKRKCPASAEESEVRQDNHQGKTRREGDDAEAAEGTTVSEARSDSQIKAKGSKGPPFLSQAHEEWNDQFKKRLPAAAKARDPCQEKWPVRLDHCFGRIILDKVIGVDQPWTSKLKGPAIRNMSEHQAEACNALATDILNGKVSLVDLDEHSLAVRGKKRKTR